MRAAHIGGILADKKKKKEEKTAPMKVFNRSCPFVCIKGIHCHLQRQTWGKRKRALLKARHMI